MKSVEILSVKFHMRTYRRTDVKKLIVIFRFAIVRSRPVISTILMQETV